MAKEPIAGAVKTRLADVVRGEAGAELYRAFLLDKADQVVDVRGADAYVAYTPPDAGPRMLELFGDGVGLVPQRGRDLGERLAGVADALLEGHDGVLLVDSDTPNLPTEYLDEAVRAVREADVVLGPAWDGGYYLIGLREPCPALFEGIAWSTPHVLSATVSIARARGLSVHFLPSWYDVDEPADLRRLSRDLRQTPSVRRGYPQRTAEVMRRLISGVEPAAPRDEHWKTLSARRAYQNRWTRVDESVVSLPNGSLTLYGVVSCAQCVGIVPLLPDGRVLLVRQFRYVARKATWEIPTGAANEGEEPAAAAQRELREETGYAAGRLERLTSFHTSKSIMDEVAHLYAGMDLDVNF